MTVIHDTPFSLVVRVRCFSEAMSRKLRTLYTLGLVCFEALSTWFLVVMCMDIGGSIARYGTHVFDVDMI